MAEPVSLLLNMSIRCFSTGSRALGLAFLITALAARKAQGQSRVEYKYERYQEDNDRTKVETHGFWFESELASKFTIRGQYVHDALSGATPTGGPPPAGTNAVPLTRFQDIRNAGFLEGAFKAGRTTTTPQVAYSEESDYRSLGLALTEAIDFNQKNTTLVLGISRNSDSLNGTYQRQYVYKNETSILLGINQLLSPLTVLTANLTFGYQDGYLNDPYKGVNFTFSYPNPAFDPVDFDVNLGEKRPRHKFKQIGYLGFTQSFPKLNGSADLNYRLHHDDWGIWANTIGLEWNQKLGSRVMLSPLFRYHRQTAADFYAVRFHGDPLLPDGGEYALQSDGVTVLFTGDEGFPGDGAAHSIPGHPNYFSSDYRLSALESFTVGAALRVKLCEHAYLSLAYKRYMMRGLDGITPKGQYPSAHAFTIGLGMDF